MMFTLAFPCVEEAYNHKQEHLPKMAVRFQAAVTKQCEGASQVDELGSWPCIRDVLNVVEEWWAAGLIGC